MSRMHKKRGNHDDCYSLYCHILFAIYIQYIGSNPLYSRISDITLVTFHFISLPNVFLNFKQAIARFPQLVRHQIVGQQTTTAVPITQSCTPAPIRAPGEGGGAQPMR